MDPLLEEAVREKEKRQQEIYEEIERRNKHVMEVLNNIGQNSPKDNLIFLYGWSGTGKSYLIQKMDNNLRKKLISALEICYDGNFVVNLEKIKSEQEEYDLLIIDHAEFIMYLEILWDMTKETIEDLLKKGKKVILISPRDIRMREEGKWIVEQRNFLKNG